MQRYEEFSELIKTQLGKRRYATMYYPSFQKKSSDFYLITKSSDRLDLLAYQFYGDSRYWPIIAKANKLHNATLRIPEGIRIRIPDVTRDEIESEFRNKQF